MQFVVCPKSDTKCIFEPLRFPFRIQEVRGNVKDISIRCERTMSEIFDIEIFSIAQEKEGKFIVIHFHPLRGKSKVDRQQWSELWCKGCIKSIFPPAHPVQGYIRTMNWLSGAETSCTLTMDRDLSTFRSEVFALVRRAERRVYRFQVILSLLVIFLLLAMSIKAKTKKTKMEHGSTSSVRYAHGTIAWKIKWKQR